MGAHGHLQIFSTEGAAQADARRLPAFSWILSPGKDLLFIIVAPALLLLASALLFGWMGAAAATSIILTTHVVMTVAHHLPTFLRVYGDLALFRQHRWTFLLAPAIPFFGSLSVLCYINSKGYPVENVLYLFILLTLWDPWHFLMQHYGFARLYDRHSPAPKRLGARMDRMLSIGCFVSIMILCVDWLPALLEDLHRVAGIPLVLMVPDGFPRALGVVGLSMGSGCALAYLGYLVYCRHRGWAINPVKIALHAIFLATMYLAYTPNPWMQRLAPGWSFKVGFAVIGIVHMTQYLAIVWQHNRKLARVPGRVRPGLFLIAFARGGAFVCAVYVVTCLAYGALVSRRSDATWVMTILLALGFTSTLMHYYFDGFIWKAPLRQRVTAPVADEAVSSSHPSGAPEDTGRPSRLRTVVTRHAIYFGLPMAVLSACTLQAWQTPSPRYTNQMLQAQQLARDGDAAGARDAARSALSTMDAQLPLARKLALLQPNASRHAALAFLVHDQARYRWLLLPSLDDGAIPPSHWSGYAQAARRAAELMEQAARQGGSPAHASRESMTAQDASRIAAAWRREVASIE